MSTPVTIDASILWTIFAVIGLPTVANVLGAVWFAASMKATVGNLAEDVSELKTAIQQLAQSEQDRRTSAAVMRSELEQLRSEVQSMRKVAEG